MATIAQREATVRVSLSDTGAIVAPTLHGVFFEEISHGGEGGIYAELIQNRGFEEANIPPGTTLKDGFIFPPATPHFSLSGNAVSDWKMEWPNHGEFPAWTVHANGNAAISELRTSNNPLNDATPHSLQIEISKADAANTADVINEGFWGINVQANENYNLNFFLRGNYKGQVKALLVAQDGTILGSCTSQVNNDVKWRKYVGVIKAQKTDTKAKFVLRFDRPGTVWLDFVSLFPQKTFHNRPNGLRQDLAQYIADLKPAFIRWPGGCFVEGITIQSAPDWKATIGPVEKRHSTYSPWGYWTSNGFGYHEYLQYCEDIGAAALYVFNAGVSCDFRSGTFAPDDSLQPYIQSALDAIDYAIGPVNSKWGKLRAANGHPKPFPLQYVEIGNEQNGPRYAERYNIFYDAIKAKYPNIKTIASMGIGDVNDFTLKKMRRVDFADEHAYKSAGWAMRNFEHFDKYKRGAWDIYVGEYATNAGVGAGNMEAALNDAVYIMSMEKNGDLVKMSSYAPLLVNTNDIDWPVNLINFDNAQSFARISYYAIKMMNENRAGINVKAVVNIGSPVIKKPAFAGGIGLATWDTKTAYKDIEVIQNGKTIFKSDFINDLNNWQFVRGQWGVNSSDSSLQQTAEGAQQFEMLKNKSFETYTLQLKAKKLEGYNAFIIPFAVKDSNTFYRAHIGAWVNKVGVFEKVTNGYDVSNISSTVNLPDSIQAGKWYDIRLEVGLDTVKCFLNDKLIMTYSEPVKMFAIAGKDDKTGDAIIKVVNGYGDAVETDFDLTGFAGSISKITQTTLKASSLNDENSFAEKNKFVPVNYSIEMKAKPLHLSISPYSINVIRISTK
ncbi:hypothetical protein KTO63_10380 [Parasegetibacter sp. MAH-26]|uniref:non-reducing end alpha-L-arabinofuranosidase n=2 Tax=Pinibacter aurantiacus TaxID=2851599 RepID=A0A9E2W2P4_9BACT|nr:hypothetical protein [Pinibacter aurantiacus]